MKPPRDARRFPPRQNEPLSVAGRVPPHDLDAEAAVLSAIMLDRMALDRVVEILKPEYFYSDSNGKIFEAALELAKASKPIDIVQIGSYLRDREQIAQIGGASYLAQLSDATPAVAHVHAHAMVVAEKWRLRQLIATCQRVAAEGYGDVGVIQEFIDGAEQEIYKLAHSEQRNTSEHVGKIVPVVFKKIADAAERGDRITGISTGFERLDTKTAGLHIGDLTIVAARPGMGKTSAVMNIGVNVASSREIEIDDPARKGAKTTLLIPGGGVVVFSLEMPKEQLVTRMMCSEGRVDLGKVRVAALQPADWTRMAEAARYVQSLPLWIDDTPAMGLLAMRARIRRHQVEYNRPATETTPERKVVLVIVDYLQLMKGDGHFDSREQEVSSLSRGLKQLAKELGVTVIALSQLNRAVETRSTKDKHPQLSDLRESGSLEQDADNIIFIYRDEYYFKETTQKKGIAELDIAKQRNGPTGKVMLRFTETCTRFDNLADGDYPEMEDES